MKARFNGDGALEIERNSVWRTQVCVKTDQTGLVHCCDACPLMDSPKEPPDDKHCYSLACCDFEVFSETEFYCRFQKESPRALAVG